MIDQNRERTLSQVRIPKHCKLITYNGQPALLFKKDVTIPFEHMLTPTMNVEQLLVRLKTKTFITAAMVEIPDYFAHGPNSLLPCTSAPSWPMMFAGCLLHDWLYWMGGVKHSKAKAFADILLYEIIKHNAKYYWNDRRRGWLSRRWGSGWAYAFLKAVRIIAPLTRAWTYREDALSATDPSLKVLWHRELSEDD